MDPRELLLTAARAVAVYLLMLAVVRALGKRTVGNFTAFDLIVALMLGEIVDEIIYGDVRFMVGTVAIVVIAGMAYVDGWLAFLDPRLEVILEGKPTVIVRDGEFVRSGMRAERISERDLFGHLRSRGIADVREVRLAIVEHDGSISVLKHSWADSARRADVVEREHHARQAMLAGADDPPPAKRCDSPSALGQAS